MSHAYEGILAGIVLGSIALNIFLLCRSFKHKVIREFENGVAFHYLPVARGLKDEEFLFFTFRHFDTNQLLFAFGCWVIRKFNPKITLKDFCSSSIVSDRDMNERNIATVGRQWGMDKFGMNNNVGDGFK